MNTSIGKRLALLRKKFGWTQEEVAQKLNVSAQAVSKWENDTSMPDISLITTIATLYETTTDFILGNDKTPIVSVQNTKKDLNKLVFRINIRSVDGDKVKVNLPMPLVLVALETGLFPKIDGRDVLKDLDIKKIIDLVEQGALGRIVEIESKDGDIVEIVVE